MEFCRSVSVPCVDLTDRLQQAVREGVDAYAPTDSHWDSGGHAVVAAELERVLRGLDLVSLPQPGSHTRTQQPLSATRSADRAASGATAGCAIQKQD
jgi:SGNH hydrolase-like domain, acetyltransferase AlgX